MNVVSQTLPNIGMVIPRPYHVGILAVSTRSQAPLLLLENQETSFNSLIVDQEDILVKKTYTDSLLLVSLGEKAKHGVVVAELKSKRPLFRLEHVLDYYKVSAEKRQLRVLVNNKLVDPKLLLADITRIAKVEVVIQDKHSPIRYSWNENEEFLNIVTVK